MEPSAFDGCGAAFDEAVAILARDVASGRCDSRGDGTFGGGGGDGLGAGFAFSSRR